MSHTPSEPAEAIGERLDRARRACVRDGLAAMLLGPGADLRYLLGYHAPPLERLTLLVLPADGPATLITPRLERARAEAAGVGEHAEIVTHGEADDPYALVAARVADFAGPGGQPGSAAVGPVSRLAVGDRLWSVFLLGLQRVLPGMAWVPASTVTQWLRMRKSPDEVVALRRAAAAIDRVHTQVPSLLRAGRTEAEVAADIGDRIVAEGHQTVNFVIVGSGPNGASPHHDPGQRRLGHGDPVVIDIGGSMDGYCSDCTRDYVVGGTAGAPDGYGEAHAALEAAQAAACEAVAPGVTAGSVDEAARGALAEAGWADAFIHRTGHGIGLEEHEEPYIGGGHGVTLEPGMVFSIEPGIYLEGRFGQRIEDIVAVTADGVERLNTLPRTPTSA
jgi:Xaa-Pro aminopeptidase